jgi:ribonuclease D
MMEPRWIDDQRSFSAFIDELRDEPRYALDTEFHGERTYWPRLALVQVAWPTGLALIDPFAVDMKPFAEILGGRGLMVAHASEQDLAILARACGRLPAQLFDTQIAAGFIGMGAPSLASLVERLLDVRLTKGDRLTDWTRRPLTVEQRLYAAADVEHLLEVHDILVARLEPMGRLTWATDECEERRLRVRTRPEPDVAWWRMKGARQLRGKSRGVAQEVGAWRERTAANLDVPPRFVLSDLALIGVVSRPPRNREELLAIRGVDGRSLREGTTDALLAAIEAGLALDPATVKMPESDHIDRALAPAVTVIGAWLAQRASELDLDPAVLATRADLTQLLHGAPSRISTGWRHDLVGAPIQRLLAGESTIVLRDGGRRVELRDQ